MEPDERASIAVEYRRLKPFDKHSVIFPQDKQLKIFNAHACQQAIKTDAPQSVVWDVLKKWVNEHAPLTKVNEKSPGAKIMGVESSTYVFPMPSNPI